MSGRHSIWFGLALVLALSPGVAAGGSGGEAAPPDVEALLRRTFERARTLSEAADAPVYVHRKGSVVETLDGGGSVRRTVEKEYRVTLTRGMTHNRLMAVNGRALSAEESSALSERERRWRDKYAVGPGESSTERMDQLVNERLFERFDFTWVRREAVRGRGCHVLTFRPKAGPLPDERLMDRVINRLRGTVWIDETEFEIARAEAHTEGALRVWGGLLGALEFFELAVERDRGVEGVWFNRHVAVEVRGRKLWSTLHLRMREEGGDLRRWTDDATRVTVTATTP